MQINTTIKVARRSRSAMTKCSSSKPLNIICIFTCICVYIFPSYVMLLKHNQGKKVWSIDEIALLSMIGFIRVYVAGQRVGGEGEGKWCMCMKRVSFSFFHVPTSLHAPFPGNT